MHARGGIPLLTLVVTVAACSDRTPGLLEAREPGFRASATSADFGAETPVFRTDSSSISGFGCWADGNRSGCVQVSRSRIGSDLTTFLFYFVNDCRPLTAQPDTSTDSIPGDSVPPPPQCTTLESGFGAIPPSDLAGSGITSLRLRTNTSAASNPDFIRDVGSGGEIAVDWTRSGGFSIRTTGNTRFTSGDFAVHSGGSTWFSEALVAGTVVGVPVGTTTFASIFRSQQLSIGRLSGS